MHRIKIRWVTESYWEVILASVVEPGLFEKGTCEQGLKDGQEVGENTLGGRAGRASAKALGQDLVFV